MILVTLANLVFLVFVAGLTGPYIFLALLLCYVLNYAALRVFCKVEIRTGDPEDLNDALKKENQSFIAMAALSSLWLPSVVGRQSQRIFLVSSITSLATKVLLLGVAVALAESGLQSYVHPRPFLLFCFPNGSPVLNQTGVRSCKFSEDTCGPPKNVTHETRIAGALSAVEEAVLEYEWILNAIGDDDLKQELFAFREVALDKSSTYLAHINVSKVEIDQILFSAGVGKVQQKIRICEENETPFRLSILSGLLVVLALAAYATHRLHRIADYRVFENEM